MQNRQPQIANRYTTPLNPARATQKPGNLLRKQRPRAPNKTSLRSHGEAAPAEDKPKTQGGAWHQGTHKVWQKCEACLLCLYITVIVTLQLISHQLPRDSRYKNCP